MRRQYSTISQNEVEWKKSVQKTYNMLAKVYENLYGAEQERKHAIVLSLLSSIKGQSIGAILDAGCATGLLYNSLLKFLNNTFKVYVGIDISLEMVKRAKSKFHIYSNVEFVNADIEFMPLKNRSIDVTISVTVFNNLYNVEKGLSEVLRVLKEDGITLITILKQDIRSPIMLKKFKMRSFKILQKDSKDYILFYTCGKKR